MRKLELLQLRRRHRRRRVALDAYEGACLRPAARAAAHARPGRLELSSGQRQAVRLGGCDGHLLAASEDGMQLEDQRAAGRRLAGRRRRCTPRSAVDVVEGLA